MHETVAYDAAIAAADDNRAEHDLNVTEDDLLEAKELAATFTLEGTRDVCTLSGLVFFWTFPSTRFLRALLTYLAAYEPSLGHSQARSQLPPDDPRANPGIPT